MRTPLYDVNARRKTVSITLNADLVAKASALGINISRTAEAAVIQAFEAAETRKDPRRDPRSHADGGRIRRPSTECRSTTGRTKPFRLTIPTMQHDLFANPNARVAASAFRSWLFCRPTSPRGKPD